MGFSLACIHAERSSFPQGFGETALAAELIDKLTTFLRRGGGKKSIAIAPAAAQRLINLPN